MSPIHADTLDTPQKPLDVEKGEKEVEENNKDTSLEISTKGQEGPNVLEPQIEENKEENKTMLSVTIVVPSTDVQERTSGHTHSPSPKLVLGCNTSTYCTWKAIKDYSRDIEVSLDGVIKMLEFDLENLTLEKTILLQEMFAKKKRQEEIRRRYYMMLKKFLLKNLIKKIVGKPSNHFLVENSC